MTHFEAVNPISGVCEVIVSKDSVEAILSAGAVDRHYLTFVK